MYSIDTDIAYETICSNVKTFINNINGTAEYSDIINSMLYKTPTRSPIFKKLKMKKALRIIEEITGSAKIYNDNGEPNIIWWKTDNELLIEFNNRYRRDIYSRSGKKADIGYSVNLFNSEKQLFFYPREYRPEMDYFSIDEEDTILKQCIAEYFYPDIFDHIEKVYRLNKREEKRNRNRLRLRAIEKEKDDNYHIVAQDLLKIISKNGKVSREKLESEDTKIKLSGKDLLGIWSRLMKIIIDEENELRK